MTKVTIHVASFAAVHLVRSNNFARSSNFGSCFFRTNTVKQSSAAKTTSKNVSANGETLTTTNATAIDAYARSAQDAASTAQYRFTENERKSTEKATMANTATMAAMKDVAEEFEKTKNPATMVRSRQVSEYAARTPARS